jgi:hypothetical protein
LRNCTYLFASKNLKKIVEGARNCLSSIVVQIDILTKNLFMKRIYMLGAALLAAGMLSCNNVQEQVHPLANGSARQGIAAATVSDPLTTANFSMVNTRWKISSYIRDGKQHAGDYKDYTFGFGEPTLFYTSVTVYDAKGQVAASGGWYLYDNTSGTVPMNLIFGMHFNVKLVPRNIERLGQPYYVNLSSTQTNLIMDNSYIASLITEHLELTQVL